MVAHVDPARWDAELICGDLREGGLKSLTDRGDANPDHEGAVERGRDRGALERPRCVGLRVSGQAEPDALTALAAARSFRAQRVVVGMVEQAFEEGGKVPTLVRDRRCLTSVEGERHPVHWDQASASHICGIDVELSGDEVDHPLADEGRLRHARPAKRPDRRPVAQDGGRLDLERPPRIGTR